MAIRDSTAMSGSGYDGWTLRYDVFDALRERGVEGAFSVSNGSFGVRAAVEEGSAASNPSLLVAGIFVPTPLPAAQTLLAIDDPSMFTMLIDGQPVQVPLVDTREHLRVLDLRDGVMRRSWAFVDERGRRWLLESSRAASATEPGVYIHRVALRLEAGDPAQVALRFHDIVSSATVEPGALRLVTTADVPGLRLSARRHARGNANVQEGGLAASLSQASPLNIDSLSLIAPAAPGSEDMREAGADQVDEAHRDEWRRRWEGCDVEIGGHPALQRAVRFALYHLLSASPVNEGRSSIGARNLSGEAYHGHVFWDTEIFVLPALTFSRLEAARSALLYRWRTLDAARDRARSSGYKGALYAWESTDTGETRAFGDVAGRHRAPHPERWQSITSRPMSRTA
jgi:kojibiose phosphorylase